MPDNLFDDLGPFADGLTNSKRGKLAGYLTKACRAIPEAQPAMRALGSMYDPKKLDEARRLLNALPALPRRHIIAKFANLARLSQD